MPVRQLQHQQQQQRQQQRQQDLALHQFPRLGCPGGISMYIVWWDC